MGFGGLLLITLGTSVGAKAISSNRPRGSRESRPVLTDLFMTGTSPDLIRIQQIILAVLIGVMFVITVVMNYSSLQEFPEIPPQLLILMGISSSGYLLDRYISSAGPNILRVTGITGSNGGVTLTITGVYFQKESIVLWGLRTDNQLTEVSGDLVKDNTTINLTLPGENLENWKNTAHVIIVKNPDDTQYSKWEGVLNTTGSSYTFQGESKMMAQ
jgi:hypothetical protein